MDGGELFRIVLLALVQGLTEFLPISSSAHLILPSALFGWEDQGLAFDVAVHLGTLLAVVAYFRGDITRILQGMVQQAATGKASPDARLGRLLVLATLPVVITGFLLEDWVGGKLRRAEVIAATTILFALLLWAADRRRGRRHELSMVSVKTAVIIGLAQILSLIPGTSRSGITMTAALFCDLDRRAAARFSFLMSIPVIAGAALLMLLQLAREPVVAWGQLATGLALSALTAYLCIHFFLRFIEKIGFMPFVLYRLGLGALLLLLLWFRL